MIDIQLLLGVGLDFNKKLLIQKNAFHRLLKVIGIQIYLEVHIK